MTGQRSADGTVGIIGLGYVGLPLVVAFAEAGLSVIGLDVSAEKVDAVSAGRPYIEDVASDDLAALVRSGRLAATTDPARLAGCEAVLLCVPTPLGQYREPDLSFVIAAAETAIANLAPGALLVLESTTWPGTTREVLAPMLEAAGRTIGRDAFLAFSPERVDPGNTRWRIRETPKVVGGLTLACSGAPWRSTRASATRCTRSPRPNRPRCPRSSRTPSAP